MVDGRLSCCVPFCRRWKRGNPADEWICWEHWKRIPLPRRRAYFRAVAERNPRGLHPRDRIRMPRWMQPRPERSIEGGRYERPRSIRGLWRLWDSLKRTAIGKAL